MEDALEFVQMTVPAGHLVMGAATRRPGRSADALVEGQVEGTSHPVFRARVLLRGLDPDAVQALQQALSRRYAAPVMVEGDRLRYDIRHGEVGDALLGVLFAFQAMFGPVWMRFAQGRLTLRAQAVGCTSLECAARLRKALRMAGIRRQVRVVAVPSAQLQAWRELAAWRAAEEGVPAPASPA